MQTDDIQKPGFVPIEILGKYEKPLCRRCFRIRHYSDDSTQNRRFFLFDEVLEVLKNCDHSFYVVDLMDLTGSLNLDFLSVIPSNYTVLLNKFDLLPKRMDAEEIVFRVSKRYSIPVKTLFPISTLNRYGIDGLKERLSHYQRAALWGYANVGKSSLLNALVEDQPATHEATVSPFLGTTGDRLELLTSSGAKIIDMPGIKNESSILEWVKPNDQHLVGKSKKIFRRIFYINDSRTLFLGGMARFDIHEQGTEHYQRIVHLYTGENVTVHDTSAEKAHLVHKKHFGTLLKPPYSSSELSKIDWTVFTYSLQTNQDLSISGLGWLYVKKGPVCVTLHIPRGVKVEMRESLLGSVKVAKENSR